MTTTIIWNHEKPGYKKPEQPAKPKKPEPAENAGFGTSLTDLVLPCKSCNGDGYKYREGFSSHEDGKEKCSFNCRWEKCISCDGAGYFQAPNLKEIVQNIKGRKPNTLRSARPKDEISYYVWRIARFHSGKDVCLPMMAEMMISGYPYKDILEELARIIAKQWFGSDKVGTARWQQAMYGKHEFPELPKVLDGPVFDKDKPLEEYIETA